MPSLRTSGLSLLTTLLMATLGLQAHAQSLSSTGTQPIPPAPLEQLSPSSDLTGITEDRTTEKLPEKLPDAPHVTAPPANVPSSGSILGTVLDPNGAEIPGAVVTLENTASRVERTLTTDDTGFFKFDSVEPGVFTVTVTSTGFAPWVANGLTLHSDQTFDIPSVELRVASAASAVIITATPHDIAEDEMHLAEKQRVLGVFPNFYASYVWNAAPLSSGQKFRLALRTTTDPVSIAIPAFIAGAEMGQEDFSGYGPGARGFARRFAASYTDAFSSTMFGGAILPSILHQDPRYFYKGYGTTVARALYAVSTVVICKGDNGRWQPNYSNVLGNLASAGLSNAYYPSANRGAELTFNNWLIGTGSGAIGNLFQEFVVRKMTRNVHYEPGP
jgi:Carboxypeptidase regulatory-like domain